MERLDAVEARVLGALLEKEIATPEYYPLTLNALAAACNQKTNREPVSNYTEDDLEEALAGLRAKGFAATVSGAGMRVPKHRERLAEKLNLGRRELALVCMLLLRGPQTLGELRDRSERLHPFSDLAEVESVLDHLMSWEPEPLVARLARLPGTKEPRYAHLLSGEPVVEAAPAAAPAPTPREDRLAALAAEVSELRSRLESLERQFADFRRQFE